MTEGEINCGIVKDYSEYMIKWLRLKVDWRFFEVIEGD